MRVQRLRHLERVDRARGPVGWAVLNEEAAVEQHAHGLDRVQRHSLRPAEDAVAQVLGQSGNEAREQLVHRLRRERLEEHRREVAAPRTPGRPALEELRAGERDDEEGMVARPVEQVLDEVEQAFVRPLQVLEGEHSRIHRGEALEEEPPCCEQVVLLVLGLLGIAEQMCEPRLDERALLGVE